MVNLEGLGREAEADALALIQTGELNAAVLGLEETLKKMKRASEGALSNIESRMPNPDDYAGNKNRHASLSITGKISPGRGCPSPLDYSSASPSPPSQSPSTSRYGSQSSAHPTPRTRQEAEQTFLGFLWEQQAIFCRILSSIASLQTNYNVAFIHIKCAIQCLAKALNTTIHWGWSFSTKNWSLCASVPIIMTQP